MEVKSTKKIIVVRMLDWAIVALVILLFLVVLVGLTTNKAISFWGLQFNIHNNYSANDRSNFIDNPNPIVPTSTSNSTATENTNAAVPTKVIPNNIGSKSPITNNVSSTAYPKENKTADNGQSSVGVIKPVKKDPVLISDPINRDPSSRIVRKSKYASSSPYYKETNNQQTQEQAYETEYSSSNNGNPYINNGSYRIPKEVPRNSNNNMSGARNFSLSEMNEFMRQFPNRKTDIHFVHFGYLDAEMEAVRAQILEALNKYNDYTSINEVHFGVSGYSGANFYIPKAKN
jgi:cytoskeletal protein RodZ